MMIINAPAFRITPKRMLVLTTLKENVVEARRAKIVEVLKRIWTGAILQSGGDSDFESG